MEIIPAKLEGVLLLKPKRFADHRGFFAETFNRLRYSANGIDVDFVQDNHSMSVQNFTLRGLHFQKPPYAQDKLVRCGRGVIYDVAVDIRQGSPTFGHWVGFELSADDGQQLFIPSGFAHGFMTLQPMSEIVYKCSSYYKPEAEGALRWDDPEVDIKWPAAVPPVLSDKDAVAPLLSELISPFIWEG